MIYFQYNKIMDSYTTASPVTEITLNFKRHVNCGVLLFLNIEVSTDVGLFYEIPGWSLICSYVKTISNASYYRVADGKESEVTASWQNDGHVEVEVYEVEPKYNEVDKQLKWWYKVYRRWGNILKEGGNPMK